MRAALRIPPGDHELAVTKSGDRRLILRAGVRIGIDQELIAHLDRVGIKALAEDIDTGALTGICGTIVIAPGHDKAAVIETGD